MQVFVHGGVSGTPITEPTRLDHAVQAGLAQGSPLDAVEAATRVLEDDPAFNAGTGAVLNRDGMVELDAAVADGSSSRYGGVAAATVRNPISLARRVMDETPHVLIVGEGARELGRDLEAITPTAEQRLRWERASAAGELTDSAFGDPATVDTVGAVSVDGSGRLAAASSTGGVFGKRAGRVGDAAIFGAGLFASKHAAVVGTGVGELFIRWLAAYRVAALIESGAPPQEACRTVIALVARDDPRPVGLLAVSADGDLGVAYAGAGWQVEGPEGPVAPELVRTS